MESTHHTLLESPRLESFLLPIGEGNSDHLAVESVSKQEESVSFSPNNPDLNRMIELLLLKEISCTLSVLG